MGFRGSVGDGYGLKVGVSGCFRLRLVGQQMVRIVEVNVETSME